MAINTQNTNLRISAGTDRQFPSDQMPQIALSGRSNVGKSSLINTLLGRMVDKEIIYYEQGTKAKQYYPNVSRDDAALAETESLIERVYQGSVSMMMNTLVKKKDFSKEEITELYDILKGLEDDND